MYKTVEAGYCWCVEGIWKGFWGIVFELYGPTTVSTIISAGLVPQSDVLTVRIEKQIIAQLTCQLLAALLNDNISPFILSVAICDKEIQARDSSTAFA